KAEGADDPQRYLTTRRWPIKQKRPARRSVGRVRFPYDAAHPHFRAWGERNLGSFEYSPSETDAFMTMIQLTVQAYTCVASCGVHAPTQMQLHHHFSPSRRFAAKKSVSTAPQRSARTPPMTCTRGFGRGSLVIWYSVWHAPAFGSTAP